MKRITNYLLMNIKKVLAKLVLILVIGSSIALPLVSFAAVNSTGGNVSYSTPSLWPTGFWGPIVWCTGNYLPGAQGHQVSGPKGPPAACNNLCDLIGTVVNVIYLAISIAIFIIAPIILVVGGVMIMLAGANPGMLENGKKALMSAVIGLIIVLCSYLIVNTVLWALNITAVGGFNGNPSTCQIQ